MLDKLLLIGFSTVLGTTAVNAVVTNNYFNKRFAAYIPDKKVEEENAAVETGEAVKVEGEVVSSSNSKVFDFTMDNKEEESKIPNFTVVDKKDQV